MSNDSNPTFQMLKAVCPVLLPYTQVKIVDELWHRPGLDAQERAIVTVSTLVARNSTNTYNHYMRKAIDSGLKPRELSELMVHLAFYAGFPYAFSAIAVLRDVFEEYGVSAEDLPELTPKHNISDEVYSANPAIANASKALRHYTDDLLYQEVWARPDLSRRNRLLATIAVLAALAQSEVLPFYLKRAISIGVTHEEIGELLGHTGFYAGWGHASHSALIVSRFCSDSNSETI